MGKNIIPYIADMRANAILQFVARNVVFGDLADRGDVKDEIAGWARQTQRL